VRLTFIFSRKHCRKPA